MYLKKVEIIGFKSFADKTILTFEPGVTGIVGPNGSGKSNITEAVRWVLGETSAKSLRGGKMPDIIFAGSQSRKPLNIAEATVILDNEDGYLPLEYTEIAVTRRLNRNGDSDYYINKKRARLKDIQELFMDSGLGKESFSIISQGKVEAIFNSKPEDRRGIFEEAAGVFKYKQRKKAAEQKLFETEDNLNRVKDIIYELKEQLLPLEEESKNAKKHLKLKDSLKEIEVAVTGEKIYLWQKEWETLKEQTQLLQHNLEEITEKEAKVATLIAEKKQLQKTLTATKSQSQEKLLATTRQLEQAQGKQALFQQETKTTKEKLMKLTLDQENLAKEIQSNETKINQLQEAILKNQQELDNLEELVFQQQQAVMQYSRSIKEQLADLKSEYIELLQQETQIQNDVKHLDKVLNQDQQQQAVLKEKQRFLNEEETSLATELASLKERKTAGSEKLAKIIQLVETKEMQLSELHSNQDNLQQEYYRQLGVLQQKTGRLKSLKEISQSHAGYYQGVRGVLKNQQLVGIKGAVAELMEVPEKYALAIETALSGSMQHVVVENEKAAQLAIEYLKRQHLGRATFLPLTTIKSRVFPQYLLPDLQKNPGFVGIASEVISFQGEYSQIYGYLLGTTLLATDLPAAVAIAKQVRHQFKVVSLTGEIMNAGGSMTGGAQKSNQRGLLTQKNEEKTLSKEVASLEETIKVQEGQLKEQQEKQKKLQSDIEVLRKNEAAGRLFLQEISSTITIKEKDSQQLQKEKKLMMREEEGRFIEITENQQELENLKEQQDEVILKKAQLNEEIQLLENTGDTNETLKQQAQEKLQQAEKNQAVTLEKQHHYRHSLEDLETLLQSQKEKEQTLALEISSLKPLVAVSKEELITQIESLKATEEKLQQVLANDAKEITVLENSLETLEQQEKTIKIKKETALKEQGIATSKKVQLESYLDHGLQFLQEEYQLSYEAAKKQYPLKDSLTLGEEKVKELKNQLQSLGAVNLGAIEQYQQVYERYEFLTSQQEDLLLAKEHLFTTMDEMDEKVKARFYETFTQINQQFQIVFPKMFGGGKATLLLTAPEDLLNTGVEIQAQPPGKKLQSLNLLSGGERALTAITLLFAILQVRPVPFTILDEVEAALDEANVTRFGNYLQSFKEERQFIVVTHRKGTMVSCDVLYGVTMEESGVSKVLSVALTDVKDNGEIVARGK